MPLPPTPLSPPSKPFGRSPTKLRDLSPGLDDTRPRLSIGRSRNDGDLSLTSRVWSDSPPTTTARSTTSRYPSVGPFPDGSPTQFERNEGDLPQRKLHPLCLYTILQVHTTTDASLDLHGTLVIEHANPPPPPPSRLHNIRVSLFPPTSLRSPVPSLAGEVLNGISCDANHKYEG